MPKSISASEAKTKFGAIVEWASESNDDVIIESHGKPRVVIMSFSEYQKVLNLREEARRREALAVLRRLRDRVRARNLDLSEADAAALAERFSREIVEDMVEEKKVVFEG